MKRLKLAYKYNVHDIVNRLYRDIPLIPTSELLQDLAQDIQNGRYDDCGDPNVSWEKWKQRCMQLLKERNIIDIIQNRNFISTTPVKKPDNIIKTNRLNSLNNKEMTLDDAINHCKEIIQEPNTCEDCKKEHTQLINWLTELKEYKKMIRNKEI